MPKHERGVGGCFDKRKLRTCTTLEVTRVRYKFYVEFFFGFHYVSYQIKIRDETI